MSNTIKEEQCYYATYANSMGHPAEKECSNPATRHVENKNTLQSFPVCEEHYQLVSKKQTES
jgi:hypothetical protein